MGRRHFLYGAAAGVAGALGTGCTPDDLTGSSGRGGVPVVAADAQRRSFTVSPFMTGVNGAKWYDDAYGMWDSEHNHPAPGIVGKIKKAGVGMLRYPGGTSSNLFNWTPEIMAPFSYHGPRHPLTLTFPAHSVTLLRFSPEKAGATSSDEKRTSHA
ncbi:hypothetical protein KN815_30840 [Streptomyces sp. 4503]|uniref:Uncharacterized protein n=2 Tax=Streptomyces niphimycinicus TaxID=2842201 RepID=A0ABS6CMZ4_9ACTN|nr:hypothetical protein [Streptomyces niphimycinicus]